MADRRLIDDLMIGAVDVLPEGALEAKLDLAEREGRPLRVKLGVDPTAPDIHLGHTVVLNKLRQFQDAGHVAVLIIGDYTARIGDPSGRSKTRPRLDGAVIDANAETYKEQAFHILDDDPATLDIRYNGEWLAPLTMEQLFEITATTTVARILERDDFTKRWNAHQPISMLEMLYPFAQGYDSVAIEADIELGGTDQVFNLFMGRDLQAYFGQQPQAACDAPRWRFNEGLSINVEPHMPAATIEGLRALGHQIGDIHDSYQDFGAGQFIWRLGDPAVEGYVAASDARRDGAAVGY